MVQGCTARFAIDAPTLTTFLASHTVTVTDGFPRASVTVIHGVRVTKDTQRQLRRWRQRGGTVTRRSAERVLTQHQLTLYDLSVWAQNTHRKNPITRGQL